ncbi:MAG: HD domain-containing phosphohydrolase [Halanaerobium sp.]
MDYNDYSREELYRLFLKFAFELNETIIRNEDKKFKYQEIINNIAGELGFDYAEVWEKTANGEMLKKTNIYYCRDSSVEGFEKFSKKVTFSYGFGLPGITWEEKKPIWTKNVQEKDDFIRKNKAREYDLKTGITMPIFAYDYLDAVCFFFSKNELDYDQLFVDLLKNISQNMGLSLIKSDLDNEIKKIKNNTNELHIETINKIFKLKDPYTISHQEETAEFAEEIALAMNLDEEDCYKVYLAALFHDVGKIEIPQSILAKPGKLNKEEFNLVKRHPKTGYNIVKNFHMSEDIKKVVLNHHERLDGSGYPNQLSGDEISLITRIVSTADVINAMHAHRPYRPGLKLTRILEILDEEAEKKLDREVVKFAASILKKKKRSEGEGIF